MKKKSKSRPAKRRIKEAEPFDKRKVDLSTFKPDLSPKELVSLFPRKAGIFDDIFLPFDRPIDILGAAKTVGLGRTNLTIIESTIVQADATVPFMGFDRTVSPARNPILQMHFNPVGYGITSNSDYRIVFAIETFGACTFSRGGGPVGFASPGSVVVNGKATITLIFRSLAPTNQIFAFIEQTAGGRWNCMSVAAKFPPLVLSRI